MVYMMLLNLLFLFRKVQNACQRGLDLVQPPKLAYSLLYSNIRANSRANKSEKRSNKMRFLLDKPGTPCYNSYIRIGKQPSAAFLPVYNLANPNRKKTQ